MDRVDCAVIGAGVVGLAVARAMALRGRETVVIEAEGAIGTGISSRNSEVIHAGIYYPDGSLKAQLCTQGRRLLYAYCASRGVPYKRCGKLIVATSQAEHAKLDEIAAQSIRNGLMGDEALRPLSSSQARALEPELHCTRALLSPSTGIVDSHALMLALQGDLQRAGGMVALASPVLSGSCGPQSITLTTVGGSEIEARQVVNCAGLQAQAVARSLQHLDTRHVPQEYFAKGSYFSLSGRAPFSRLIYPVPTVGGLGVHLTLDIAGQARFGPDAEWVTPTEKGFDYQVYACGSDSFYAEIRKYWPDLADDALTPAYSGIRPKLNRPGEPAADFTIQGPGVHGVRGLVNCFGIESPGLTSCLAIADHVVSLLEE
jgi:L-2-hydroxyglutarate oxidase LhgO